MKHLGHDPKEMRKHAAHEEPTEPGCVTFVFAPCCGRLTAADAVLDVRGVRGTVVSGGGHRHPVDHDWLCDGCQFRLVHDPKNTWTAATLHKAAGGAP
jgi:hypothetical protein